MIATGEQHTVREFVVAAGKELGMQITWKGKGAEECGYDPEGRRIVAVDPTHFRPTEVDSLMGDASKARERLGWKPKIRFSDLVKEMVREDLKGQFELLPKADGKGVQAVVSFPKWIAKAE